MTKKDALTLYTLTSAIHDGVHTETECINLMYIYQGIGFLRGMTESRVKHEYRIRTKLTPKETFINLLEEVNE